VNKIYDPFDPPAEEVVSSRLETRAENNTVMLDVDIPLTHTQYKLLEARARVERRPVRLLIRRIVEDFVFKLENS